MNKYSRIIALLLALIIALTFGACSGGGDEEDYNYNNDGEDYYGGEEEESGGVTASDLNGTWTTERGDVLELEFDNEIYYYSTFYGRSGEGECGIYDGRPMMDFDGFLYDFELSEDGLVLRQNGYSTDESVESLDGMVFTYDGNNAVYVPDIEAIEGYWANNEGESLYIEASDSTYAAYSYDGSVIAGNVGDNHDGKGLYLYLNGKAYVSLSLDDDRLKLYFVPTDMGEPDGSFECVFYKDGDIEGNTHPNVAKYWCDEFGGVWYYDGLGLVYIGDDYTISEDATELYDADGNYVRGLW